MTKKISGSAARDDAAAPEPNAATEGAPAPAETEADRIDMNDQEVGFVKDI